MQKVGVFNPDGKDFSVNYDINGNKNPILFTVPARDIAYFEPVVANHIKVALVTHLLHKRGVKNNPEQDLGEIMKELEVWTSIDLGYW